MRARSAAPAIRAVAAAAGLAAAIAAAAPGLAGCGAAHAAPAAPIKIGTTYVPAPASAGTTVAYVVIRNNGAAGRLPGHPGRRYRADHAQLPPGRHRGHRPHVPRPARP